MADDTKQGESPNEKKAREAKAALKEQQRRGTHAQAVLDNPLVKEAFAKIETFVDVAWKESRFEASDQRERAYYMYRALNDFRQFFKTAVNGGELAAEELKKFRQAEEVSKETKG